MSIKESLFNYLKINQLKDNVSQYVEARIQLLKMDIEDRALGVVEEVIYVFVKLLLILFTASFVLYFVGSMLNHIFKSFWIGPVFCIAVCGGILLLWIVYEKQIREKIQVEAAKKIEQKSEDGRNK